LRDKAAIDGSVRALEPTWGSLSEKPAFLNAIEEGGDPLARAGDRDPATQQAEAIYRAVREEKTVRLPLLEPEKANQRGDRGA
jgi:hypothetical protein